MLLLQEVILRLMVILTLLPREQVSTLPINLIIWDTMGMRQRIIRIR